MKDLRYLFYLAFGVAALIFWALFFILGVVPFPVEPQCALEPASCPSIWTQLLIVIAALTPLPLTVLLFIFFRRWVRQRFGSPNDL